MEAHEHIDVRMKPRAHCLYQGLKICLALTHGCHESCHTEGLVDFGDMLGHYTRKLCSEFADRESRAKHTFIKHRIMTIYKDKD